MATNPEGGGLMGFLKRLLHIETQKKAAQKIVKIETKPPAKKKELKEKAELIIQELQRITPNHHAYELLHGISFDKSTLTKNDNLANDVITILRVPDTHRYHDPKWLADTHSKLSPYKNNPEIGQQDQNRIEIIAQRLETMLQKADANRRKYELEKEFKKASWLPEEEKEGEKMREALSTETPPKDIIPTQEEKEDWTSAIDKLPLEELTKDIKIYKEKIANKDFGPRAENWSYLTGSFDNALKTALQDMNKISRRDDAGKQRFREAQQRYANLTTAYEKSARHFIETHGSEKGRLFDALRQSGSEFVEKRILEDQDYMDYWFYHIIEPILFNQRMESHRELYNLYVAGDMDAFLDIVRRKKDEHGNRIGHRLAARYNILKNTIFQAHDMDFYAAHPSQDMKEFIGSTSLFLETYIDAASQDPMVALAKRSYETALLQIRETNNGYIPREWLTWEEGKMRGSKLDELAEKILTESIKSGQLYHVKVDDVTGSGLPHPSVWNRKQIDPTKPFTLKELYGFEAPLSEEYGNRLGELKISSALKQAKGLALVDMRLLEIIGHSRGTGTEYEQAGDPDQSFSLAARQFNSVPYEGIVRHISPIIHYFTRYRVGGEYYDAFFNMIVTDWPNWDPKHMKKVVELHFKGDTEGIIKYLESVGIKDAAKKLITRLNSQENPFEFSGMWGPNTSWRIGDTTISFDDWEREQAYGLNIKLNTAGNFAERQARRLFQEQSPEYKGLRKEYRDRLLESNNIYYREAAKRDMAAEGTPLKFDDEFETLWRKEGKDRKANGTDETYRKILDRLWGEKSKDKEISDFITKLEKAYMARTWVQGAMRAPLIVARELDVAFDIHGVKQSAPLRKRIIWEILGINIDEIAAQRTPTSREEAEFDRVVELETAVTVLQQTAIRENRDLKEDDFDKQIQLIRLNKTERELTDEDQARIKNWEHARLYWKKVKDAMLGKKTAEQIYAELGIEAPDISRERGARMHKINTANVNKISDEYINEHLKSELLSSKLLGRKWQRLFSTEDMGWEYLNINALGERNPVRRAGDLASHVQFGQEFEKYLNNFFIARPEIKDLVKQQKVMWEALTGDFIDVAIPALYKIAYTTGMMYKKADISWKLPILSPLISIFHDSSIMQVIRGKDRADAWGPNDMLHYVQAVGGLQILPKREWHGLAGVNKLKPGKATSFKEYTSGKLSKMLGGTKGNAAWEIVNMTLLLATLITLWRAFTAKEEE